MLDTKNVKWLEVWIDSASASYFLVLYLDINGRYMIVDPLKGFEKIIDFYSYEDACTWLNEDEYDLIETRYHKD